MDHDDGDGDGSSTGRLHVTCVVCRMDGSMLLFACLL